MIKYTVYEHLFPNGKRYIGITSMPPEKRWGKGNGYIHNSYMHSAIVKYGWDNFQHNILFVDLDRCEAEIKEQELIAIYKSNDSNYGYNLTSGGESGKIHSQVSIQKMKDAKKDKYKGEDNPMYGYKWSEEQRQNQSQKLKGRPAINKGVPMSDQQKKKLSEARLGIEPWNKGKHTGIKTKGNTGMKWFNNGIVNKQAYECPDGFVSGQLRKAGI